MLKIPKSIWKRCFFYAWLLILGSKQIQANPTNERTSWWNEVPNTIPKGVKCQPVKKCDHHNVCAIVCAHGSVEIPLWMKESLRIQRALAYEFPLCFTQLPGSHNSGITLADGYGIEDHVWSRLVHYLSLSFSSQPVHTNDQHFSLTDQLNMGVRFLELDVHWFDSDLRIAHCGGFHTSILDSFIDGLNAVARFLGMKIQWDSQTIGCKPSLSSIPAKDQRSAKSALIEIFNWIQRHKQENDDFVVVYFDDQNDLFKWHKVERLKELVTTIFPSSLLLTLKDLPHGIESFERIPLKNLIKKGKRILFLSGENFKEKNPVKASFPWFVKSEICNWEEPSLPFLSFPFCQFPLHPEWSPNKQSLLRPQTSEIQYGPLNAGGHFGKNKGLLNEHSIPSLIECNVNIPSPDNLTPKRMEAMIWAFDSAFWEKLKNISPAQKENQCLSLSSASTKWRLISCDSKLPTACLLQKNSNSINDFEWNLNRTLVTQSKAITSCPKTFNYQAPRNGFENRILKMLLALKGVKQVWIGYSIHHLLKNLPLAPPILQAIE